MTQENLARRFKPAGFEQPEGSRHQYTKPRPELQEAFYQWLEELPEVFIPEEQHEKAYGLIKAFGQIACEEATSLLVGFKPNKTGHETAGLFISACYNRSPDKILALDIDAPEIDYIGYKLGKNSVLVNNGSVGDCFGDNSLGVALNNGNVGRWFGNESSGIIVSNGFSGYGFGYDSSGTLIALQKPEDYGDTYKAKEVLGPDNLDGAPGLRKSTSHVDL